MEGHSATRNIHRRYCYTDDHGKDTMETSSLFCLPPFFLLRHLTSSSLPVLTTFTTTAAATPTTATIIPSSFLAF
ncbi:hypothetical protein E2C01_010748 [Portunus trituberculatus]|uniref:Uncharacterized protein n=1 Tax=Portunus trituberculatus TaxID=210409 RepID=A0A5B7D982_PORTR|nr:hypothetical protein [Portunus trituberculatus]